MIKSDYHIHTECSEDSSEKLEVVIEKAISLELEEIAITDHVDYNADGSEFYYQTNYDEYIKYFSKLKAKFTNKINIILGVEVGLQPQLKTIIESFCNKYPFDFIIGSSHATEGKDLYSDSYCHGKQKEAAYTKYLEEVLECIETINTFCVYGHIDYISRYGNYKDNSIHYKDYKTILDKIIKELVKRNKGLEINTSGFRYGINAAYPQLEILKAFKKAGGEILTIGSDAHSAKYIANNFDFAENLLKEAGFKGYCLFRNKKPLFVEVN